MSIGLSLGCCLVACGSKTADDSDSNSDWQRSWDGTGNGPDASTDEPGSDPTDSSPSPDASALPDAATGCPALADTCPVGCYDIAARAIDPDEVCRAAATSHLGCTASEIKTDDEDCVATTDGTTLYTMSGTFVSVLTGSGDYRECTGQEWELVSNGLETCAFSVDAGLSRDIPDSSEVSSAAAAGGPPDASSAPNAVELADASVRRMYTAGLVNGTGCCDFIDLIVADITEDHCVSVSVVHEVGSSSQLLGAWAARPAGACELGRPWPDAAVEASGVDGLVDIAPAVPRALIELDVVLAFPDGSGLPASVAVQVTSLPVDGEWHAGR